MNCFIDYSDTLDIIRSMKRRAMKDHKVIWCAMQKMVKESGIKVVTTVEESLRRLGEIE